MGLEDPGVHTEGQLWCLYYIYSWKTVSSPSAWAPARLCAALQAVCVAQRSPVAGAGGAVLPRGGKMLPAQTTTEDAPGRKSPFPNGLWRVGCYSFSQWIWGQNLHNLPMITHSKPRGGVGMSDAGLGNPRGTWFPLDVPGAGAHQGMGSRAVDSW